tara:strand:- start:1304 stop:1459 length:156 start_codon:yes stop_codon:yes gene_type:complete
MKDYLSFVFSGLAGCKRDALPTELIVPKPKTLFHISFGTITSRSITLFIID